jgi:two-component system, NtrC family, sensor kinase
MKKLFKIGLFFLLPLSICAQQYKLDSLHQALKMSANDSVRMDLLGDLYSYYAESNWDSAAYFTEQLLVLSARLKQPLWKARGLLNKAYILQKKGNLPSVFKLINESMLIAQDEQNENNLYMPTDFRDERDPHKFRLHLIGSGFHQLGNTYSQAGNKEKAIKSYKESIRIGEEVKQETSRVNPNMNIGSIYLELGQLDSALHYSRTALDYSNNTGYRTYQGIMLRNIGTVLFKRKQTDSARFYYWQAISISREKNNISTEIAAYLEMTRLYENILRTDSMLYYGNAAFKMASTLKVGAYIASAAELISKAHHRSGHLDSAYTYLSLSKRLGDSLNKERTGKLTEFQNIGFEEQMKAEKKIQESVADKNRIKTIVLFTGLGFLSVLAFIFYRNNRLKQKTNRILENTLTHLKSTQAQLIQSEKMASLGELTAGIAHEIQNPLNFVNNFSEVNRDLLVEMKDEIRKGNLDEVNAIADDVISNEEKINHHGKRADAIVKGMLQHSRTAGVTKEPTDINKLADEYLRLAYHGLRAKDNSFNATLKTDFDEQITKINIIPQDIGRVILNLITNAFYAVDEKKKSLAASAHETSYEPTVSISTKRIGSNKVEISIADNGNGIPEAIKEKIFQPFFTTKPTGKGTGLGLSLSYDIVKAHNGEITVESEEGVGSEFVIVLKTEV